MTVFASIGWVSLLHSFFEVFEFVDTETSSLTELSKLAMHRSQMKITYVYTKRECRITERGSKVSPQEGEHQD